MYFTEKWSYVLSALTFNGYTEISTCCEQQYQYFKLSNFSCSLSSMPPLFFSKIASLSIQKCAHFQCISYQPVIIVTNFSSAAKVRITSRSDSCFTTLKTTHQHNLLERVASVPLAVVLETRQSELFQLKQTCHKY